MMPTDGLEHPGVADDSVDVDDGRGDLRIGSGGTPLAGRLPLPPEEVAGVAAVLATTLADLHERGIVHGSVDVDHVLLGRGGRPVLHDFSGGGRVGEPAAGGFGVLVPELDVAGLGTLIAGALGLPPAPGDAWSTLRQRLAARPARSWPARLGRLPARPTPPPTRRAAVELAGLARAAADPEPSRRPTAAALAAAIHERVPLARLPRPAAPAAGTRRPGPGRRGPWGRERRAGWAIPLAVAGTVVALAVVGSTALALLGRIARDGGAAPGRGLAAGRGEAPMPPTTAPPAAIPHPVAAPAPAQVWPTTTTALMRPCPDLTTRLRADVDGDGCDEAVRLEGGVLRAGDARFSVGEEGDLATVGDWDCDGLATVALLRPATGELFVFDGWAGPGEEVAARPLGRVTGAVAVESETPGGAACDRIVVQRADGSRQLVPWAPAP